MPEAFTDNAWTQRPEIESSPNPAYNQLRTVGTRYVWDHWATAPVEFFESLCYIIGITEGDKIVSYSLHMSDIFIRVTRNI